MTLSISDVITVDTADQIETQVLAICTAKGLPVTSWQSGGVLRTMIRILSEAMAVQSVTQVEIAKGGLGDTGSPEWVKIWADKIYNVQYGTASAASGSIDATNTSATTYTLDAGDLIVSHFFTGKTYRNQSAVVIPGSGSLSGITIEATELGTDSNAAPGEVTTLVTSLVGVSVTNPLPVLGSDEETADALVSRSRSKLEFLSPDGVKGAYDFVVQSEELTSGISSRITRSRTISDSTFGIVRVYVANADGPPPGGDITIAQSAVDYWAEPWCVTATVVAATPLTIDVPYQVTLRSSLTTLEITTRIASALSSYFASLPVGGVIIPPASGQVYKEKLEYIIHTAVPGVEVVDVTLSGNPPVAVNEVAVLGTITPTVVFM